MDITDLKRTAEALQSTNMQLTASEQQLQASNQQLIASEQQLKAANKSLLQSEKQFRVLAENSVDVIWQMDPRLRFTYITPSIYPMTGYTQEEWIGSSLASHATRKEFFNMARQALKALRNYKTFKSVTFQAELLRKDGSTIPVEIAGRLLYNSKGLPVGLQGSTRDITSRKQAEEKIVSAEKRFRALIENAPDGVVINDAEGKVVYASPTALKQFMYREQELYGHSGSEFTHPDDLPLVLETFSKINENPSEKQTIQYRFRRKDGEYRWIETTFSNLLDDDAIHGYVLNFTDITVRKLYEERLQAALEKAQESDRLKTAFLANMSHEIRTPMNGILGFISLLANPDLTLNQKEKYTEIISKSSDRLLTTINNLIDISRIESGQVDLHVQSIALNDMMKELYTFFEPQAQLKGLTLTVEPGLPDEEAHIRSDNEKLYATLANLLKNAIKYTQSGSIKVSYAIDKRDVTSITFYVQDTGIGIPANRLEAIFNRFEQADIEDKQALEGAGLGLSIAKAYVQLMGGKIQVDSEVGKGSVFSFTIPYQKANDLESSVEKEDQPEPHDKPDKKRLTILIAEDDEVSYNYLNTLLLKLNASVLWAKDGKEAVALCEQNPKINLILMDMRMPVMDGYQATRKIREFNSQVHILAQTAYAILGDREKAMEAGCNDYITKPIDKEELLEKIYFTFNA